MGQSDRQSASASGSVERPWTIAVVGAGPAGLMAAERLARAGCAVTVYDAMPSPARKFLMAGRGGLNITHSAPPDRFRAAYGAHATDLDAPLTAFPPEALVAWLHGLGIESFVGSSGRVFPRSFKTSPVLRAWLLRLAGLGVTIANRHRWTGFDDRGRSQFERFDGTTITADTDATILAMGGASWPRLGSNGAWVTAFEAAGIAVAALQPANCGIRVPWSAHVRERFAGTPLKRIAITCNGRTARGEAVITDRGLEGGAVYAIASTVRDATAAGHVATVAIDLRPDEAEAALARRLSVPRGKMSMATFLRKALNLDPASIALLREQGPLPTGPVELAALVKAVPLLATGCDGLERAISTAGGVRFDQVDGTFMLTALPGVFVAGEMMDWDAPTGGFLLQASFATGVAAADGASRWLASQADLGRASAPSRAMTAP